MASARSPRNRSNFAKCEVDILEKYFQKNQYPDIEERERLAVKLNDCEQCKVKNWFQNRRARCKLESVESRKNKHKTKSCYAVEESSNRNIDSTSWEKIFYVWPMKLDYLFVEKDAKSPSLKKIRKRSKPINRTKPKIEYFKGKTSKEKLLHALYICERAKIDYSLNVRLPEEMESFNVRELDDDFDADRWLLRSARLLMEHGSTANEQEAQKEGKIES